MTRDNSCLHVCALYITYKYLNISYYRLNKYFELYNHGTPLVLRRSMHRQPPPHLSLGTWLGCVIHTHTHAKSMFYGRCSNEDPAKSGLESKRILNVEGVCSQCTVQFLSAAFSEFRKINIGLWDLGMNNDRANFIRYPFALKSGSTNCLGHGRGYECYSSLME